MKETVKFIAEVEVDSPPIIGVFGAEHVGKTRFGLGAGKVVGFIPLEMKSYKTIQKDAAELGVEFRVPENARDLIASHRALRMMANDVERQKYYMELVPRIEAATYQLLDDSEVDAVVMDKFSTYCVYKEFAINGMTDKVIKIDGKLYKSKHEVVAGITEFVNGLSQSGKTIVLLCQDKADYEVTDATGNPVRRTWDCGAYKMLGSHCNITVELEANQQWKPGDAKKGWRYRLNVRRCQDNPGLEGPDGNPLLEDDMVSVENLLMAVGV